MYYGYGILFRKATYDRPYIVFVCSDALIIAQPPIKQATLSFNRAQQLKAMKYIAEMMDQALHKSGSDNATSAVVANMLRTIQDKKGERPHFELVSLDDIAFSTGYSNRLAWRHYYLYKEV